MVQIPSRVDEGIRLRKPQAGLLLTLQTPAHRPPLTVGVKSSGYTSGILAVVGQSSKR